MMSPPTRILVPTDFSESGGVAQDYASALAAALGARLHVLHVVADGLLGDGLGADAVPALLQRIELEVSHRLESWRSTEGRRGLEVITKVVRGLPEEAIVEYADAQGIDLIVIGHCEGSGPGPARLRHLANRVLQKARCPVLTVRRP